MALAHSVSTHSVSTETQHLELPPFPAPDMSKLSRIEPLSMTPEQWEEFKLKDIGNIAIIGHFEDRRPLREAAEETAEKLDRAGLTGEEFTVGSHIIGPNSRLRLTREQICRQLIDTDVYLHAALREKLASETDQSAPIITNYTPRPMGYSGSLFDNPIDRFRVLCEVEKAWEDFDSTFKNYPSDKKTLLIITTPSIGAKANEAISRSDLNDGGLVVLHKKNAQAAEIDSDK